jgi:O-antigen/teichoic acid export membrane protein
MQRRFKTFFVRVNAAVCAVMASGLVVACLLVDPLITQVYAKQYSASITLVKILLAGTAAAASLFPLTLQFLMLVRRYTFLSVDTVCLAIAVVAYAVVIPRHGAMGAAIVSASLKVSKTMLMQSIAWRAVSCAETASMLQDHPGQPATLRSE